MKKIVINRCYGGFGLSDAAFERYLELNSKTFYKRDGLFGSSNYYKIEPEEFDKLHEESIEKGDYSFTNDLIYSQYSIERDDPILIQIIEELGEESWGRFSELKVVEIPDDTYYEIQEYDGIEKVICGEFSYIC